MIRLLRRCHLPLLALLSFSLPLTLALTLYAPDHAAQLALFPVMLAPMLLLCAAVPGRIRPAALGACLLALGAAGYTLLPRSAMTAAAPLCCAALLLFALRHTGQSPAEASPMFYLACILSQLAALFFAHYMGGIPPAMQAIFCLWLMVFLLALNRISLNNATLARYRLSEGMARTGTALTLCIFALALLLCTLPAVVSGVRWLFCTLRDAAASLMLLILNLFPAESAGGLGGPPAAMMPQLGETIEHAPTWFSIMLEKIAAAVSFLVLIVGSAVLLRLLVRALVRLMRHLLARLQRYAAAVTEDYEDEITDTRGEEGENSFHPLRRRTRTGMAYPDTPEGRIRRRYAQLRRRHSAWTDSSTARENLPEHTAALYERARYSDHALSQEEAQRFEHETR